MILEKENTIQLIKDALPKAVNYESYRNTMETLVSNGKSTGKEQTDALANYTKLNHSRMRRWDKTFKIDADLAKRIEEIDQNIVFLVLTESWCGDAAQSMPIMNRIAELNPKISFKVILRDENLELMDQFLTNGGRSIPKLIARDENGNDLFDWGPRPSHINTVYHDLRKNEVPYSEISIELQKLYNKDKGVAIQNEIVQKIKSKN